ncbi:MAG: CRISPR-associated endonuclease Cas2 [Pseudothermotoga sp.]|uniref:CRISPR-associated endonuclease Cas2 n=1 Tax=Pseudothermotoga sp. TaxID=2033661 RepID=UPI0019CA798C|nr:CRISPR-associated endonuclease Cas2 [Pseudothermotoga sp.]MBC7123869.1 CRISPR-associated endonuclease Cas2 [Pseudothermotoga sp.]MDI6863704.1 CRISPR-associated endonuclease Cas2 [Pseudothermotoga sp.]
MYVIITYDVEEKRVAKVLKTCRKYLNWVQNSVFEGEITEAKLERLKLELSRIIDGSDSIRFYLMKDKNVFQLERMGNDKSQNFMIY